MLVSVGAPSLRAPFTAVSPARVRCRVCLVQAAAVDESTMTPEELAELRKRRAFKKFTYRGVDLEKLLDIGHGSELLDLLPCRIRRRFKRASRLASPVEVKNQRQYLTLLKKLRDSKKDLSALDKPKIIKTHQRNAIIIPEMVGSIVGVHNGKAYGVVEVKPEMIGKYLAEFSITYKPTLHGRPGLGATHSSRFIPLH